LEDGAAVDERDLIREPLNRAEVADLVRRAGGLDAVLATRSPAYRRRTDQDNDEAGWILAMVEEPRLIRRPILETDAGMAVGFSADSWRRLIKSSGA
jgi:arsenate reductase-like glutaredoxin family protein